jgi:CubicO group peptidase (beta-lactamase class C family)
MAAPVLGQQAAGTPTKQVPSAADLMRSYPGETWPVLDSSQQADWSNEKLKLARQYADSIGSAAVMIVQGGVVVDQWGDPAKKFNSYSIRKSMLSALYGIYVGEGKIDINQTLEQLGIDDNPPSLTKEEKQARIVDLLRARSGVYHPSLFETSTMKASRPARGSHAPGTFWFYNNWDFNVLGTIFEQKAGLSIGKAFEQRIATPVQMEDYRAEDVYYVRGPESIHPAYPCHISSRDLARFGLLYLRHGNWRNQQIVTESWVGKLSQPGEALGQYHGFDIGGYEYLWWTEADGKHFPGVDLGGGSFSARGIGGHFVVVIPARNLVIVHRVDNGDDQHEVVTYQQFGHLLKLILDAQTVPAQADITFQQMRGLRPGLTLFRGAR